jgi:hypothetical protein
VIGCDPGASVRRVFSGALAVVAVAACTPMSETSPPPAKAAAPALADRAGSLDLGDGVEVTRFAPGRFANAVDKNTQAHHALQVIHGLSRSSFVLDLGPDGSAKVCRGWRYRYFNDGPQVHTSERVNQQLGYRGRWARRGDEIDVDLRLADDVCERIEQYSVNPDHVSEWHLRCALVAPRPGGPLPGPALVCQSSNAQPEYGQDEPHVVRGVLPGHWLILGPGNGLRIKVDIRSVTGGGPPPEVHVEPSRDRIEADTWKEGF